MTEQEWLTSESPGAMLLHLQTPGTPGYSASHNLASDRKLRLFACAVARLVDGKHPDRDAVLDACEAIADSVPSLWGEGERGLRGARKSIDAVWGWTWCATAENVLLGLRETLIQMRGNAGNFYRQEEVAALLREVLGDPFRFEGSLRWEETATDRRLVQVLRRYREPGMGPGYVGTTDFAPVTWLTPTVLAIAADVYERRDFALLPVLADALEDAGCDADDLLRHLRGQQLEGSLCTYGPLPVPHVPGCWALDLVLGKE